MRQEVPKSRLVHQYCVLLYTTPSEFLFRGWVRVRPSYHVLREDLSSTATLMTRSRPSYLSGSPALTLTIKTGSHVLHVTEPPSFVPHVGPRTRPLLSLGILHLCLASGRQTLTVRFLSRKRGLHLPLSLFSHSVVSRPSSTKVKSLYRNRRGSSHLPFSSGSSSFWSLLRPLFGLLIPTLET